MKHPHFKTLALLLSLSFLLVLAGCGSSSSSSGTSPANAAPVAEAGADQHIKTGDTINLDGSGSSDADHDLLTYSWVLTSQPDGSADIFTGVDTSHPGFSADIDGDYVFTLTVNDGSVNSSEDTVTVTQETANSLPVADPGPDRFMKTGTTITLDGSGSSDADHDLLTFSWSMVTQAPLSTPVLTGANTSHPTFATDVDGIYTLQLVVNDGSDSSPQIVKINQSPDAKPVANAGPDQPVVKTISVDLHVALDGSGSSDADHDLLTYSWTTQSKPDTSAMVLKDTDTSHPTFAADVDGVYVIKLIVNDGSEDSAADTVTVTVSLANVAPVANAGPDQHDKMGVTLTLDGSGSKDANIADILTFAWTVMSKPPTSTLTGVTNPTTTSPTFVADADGIYIFKLVVNDGTNDGSVNTDTDTVTVFVVTVNSRPVANAGPDQPHDIIGTQATLDGTGSTDADPGDTLTYSWTLQSRPAASTATPTSTNQDQAFFTPDAYGDYVFKLIVNDGTVDSAADTVSLAVPLCGTGGGACMFATSTKHNGDLKTAGNGSTGLDGADKICNARAQAVNLPGTYKAWLSEDSNNNTGVSAATRMAPYTLGPIKLPDGVLIANDWADLVSGSIRNPIGVDEMGVTTSDFTASGAFVWTGTLVDGSSARAQSCNDWTTSSWYREGLFGSTLKQDSQWTETARELCDEFRRLYCLQQP